MTQTMECGYFIRDYAKRKNFWERTVKRLLSDVEVQVEQYEDKFRELKSALQRSVIRRGIIVLRVTGIVNNLEIDLNDMSYAGLV